MSFFGQSGILYWAIAKIDRGYFKGSFIDNTSSRVRDFLQFESTTGHYDFATPSCSFFFLFLPWRNLSSGGWITGLHDITTTPDESDVE